MSKQATFIRNLRGWVGEAALYRVEPPLDNNEYVVVSAANVLFSGPETYIFPAKESGGVVGWGELDGSYRGGLSHGTALRGAGYEIATKQGTP